jgi:hypothetical protein
MAEFIAIWEKVSAAGLATLLALLLFGHYKRIWFWRYQMDEVRAQLAKVEVERDVWKRGYFKSLGVIDQTFDLVTTKGNQ